MYPHQSFSAKIMLFGEYTVICGSMALMMPFDRFAGMWKTYDSDSQHPSIPFLRLFYEYLKDHDDIAAVLDIERLRHDMEHGLVFDSDIPIGYGVGSSGALVAATYSRYASNQVDDIQQLRKIFSAMESFFHGQSSGLDPLCIYVQKPMLVKSDGHIQPMNYLPDLRKAGMGMFLADTESIGMTEPLVSFFRDRLKHYTFFRRLNNELIPATNKAISALLDEDQVTFYESLRTISDFQIRYLTPMIPVNMRPIWQSGLDTDGYTMKLCGSGGGGYLLGFSKNMAATESYLLNHFPAFKWLAM